jgi:hypothetical protein
MFLSPFVLYALHYFEIITRIVLLLTAWFALPLSMIPGVLRMAELYAYLFLDTSTCSESEMNLKA